MPEISDSKYLVTMTWDDAPHLSEIDKKLLWDSIPPYQRDARTKGLPSLGAGAIYPIPESEIIVEPFEVPKHWPKAFGLDVGWNRTACVWGAHDYESGTRYLYSEYYKGAAEPVIHSSAILARGKWIPGAIDPASRGRGQKDGEKLYQMYIDLGLQIEKAENAVESGIYKVWEMLSSGRLKVFSTLQNWLSEYRIYRRDEKGHIVKANDHLMDCTRYYAMTGTEIETYNPVNFNETPRAKTEYNMQRM